MDTITNIRRVRTLLNYTSFLFGLTSWKAMQSNHWMSRAFLWQMGLSIFTHVNHYHLDEAFEVWGQRTLLYLDKVIAHYITIRSIYDAYKLPLNRYTSFYWINLLYVLYIHVISKKNHYINDKFKSLLWHSSIHLSSNLGCISLLEGLRKFALTIPDITVY